MEICLSLEKGLIQAKTSAQNINPKRTVQLFTRFICMESIHKCKSDNAWEISTDGKTLHQTANICLPSLSGCFFLNWVMRSPVFWMYGYLTPQWPLSSRKYNLCHLKPSKGYNSSRSSQKNSQFATSGRKGMRKNANLIRENLYFITRNHSDN